MLITDQIAKLIEQMIDDGDGSANVQRNDLAQSVGCVPSQVSYVISSRFTPERGYRTESRRGGGGYIRIRRVALSRSSALMHLINSIGDELDSMTARIVVENCLESGLISNETAALLSAAVSGNVMQHIPVQNRNALRAALMKNMLLTLI